VADAGVAVVAGDCVAAGVPDDVTTALGVPPEELVASDSEAFVADDPVLA
jgi:hypothetical protein